VREEWQQTRMVGRQLSVCQGLGPKADEPLLCGIEELALEELEGSGLALTFSRPYFSVATLTKKAHQFPPIDYFVSLSFTPHDVCL
jgi:hypothetical protein